MASVTFKAFRGMVPRTSQRLQAPNFADVAANLKITSGRIDPLKGLQLAHTSLAATVKTLWRHRFRNPDRSVADNWFVFDSDVDVVASPLANDEEGRAYYTSDEHEPRMTTYALAVSGPGPYPAAWYALGLPLPTVAPGLVAAGGVAPVVTRSYAYTFVNTLGQESGPSPASALVTGNASGTWTLSAMQTAPPNNGGVTGAIANTPSPGFVTVTHDSTFGLAAYDTVSYAGVTGMTDLNGSHRIVRVSGATVVIALDTAQVFTAGGTWQRNAPILTAGMTKRIYRTEGTAAQFLYVDEIPVADTGYVDTIAILNGEVMPVADALPPPKNLRCLTALPNGCLVGLANNEVCFSTPYQPQSWPVGNRYSFVGDGIALCPVGNSVIVMTDQKPLLLTGSDPESMSPSTMDFYAPCLSKRGLVDIGGGCLSPGHDGLWIVSPGRTENITSKLFREEEWTQLNPGSFDAEFHDGQYYVVHQPVGFDRPRMMVIDITEMDSIVEVDEQADDLFRNDYDGKLYLVKGNQAYRWDANDNARYRSEWTSVEVQLDQPRNFSHAQVHARWNEIVPVDTAVQEANAALMAAGPHAVNGFLGGAPFGVLPVGGTYLTRPPRQTERLVQFTLYDDETPVFTKNVTSKKPFRLPVGFKTEILRVGLSTSIGTYSASIAESTEELSKIST